MSAIMRDERSISEARAQERIETTLLSCIAAARLDSYLNGFRVVLSRTGLSSTDIAKMSGLTRAQVDQARKGLNGDALKTILDSPAFKTILLASAYSLAQGKKTYEETRRNPDGSFKRRDCKPIVPGYTKKTA